MSNAQQVLQTNRFELASPKDETSYEVVPAHESGIYLYRRLYGQGMDNIEMIKLDTAFKEQWKGYLQIDPKYILVSKKVVGNNIYFLLRYENFTKNDFVLFAVEHTEGNFLKYEIKNFIPFNPIEFQVTDKGALMGGYFNSVPVVLFYSFKSLHAKVLPGLMNESGELTQLKINSDETFDVLISARNFKGQQTIWIKNYDSEGDLQSNYALQPEDNKHLIFARSVKTANNMQLVAGVFGGKNSQYSRGLFMASIDPAGNQQLRYYNYGDLENFFKYMKAKREARVKERIERRKIKGKRVRFNYRFLVHEIVPYKNQYILLGEAFYPKYITTGSGAYSSFFTYGNRYPSVSRDGRIFDGYYYTHAVVMGFNLKGDLMWDNSFEINDVKTFTLEQFVKLEVQGDKITLLYLFDNELRTKIIHNDQVLEGKTFEPLKTSAQNDVVRRESTNMNKLDYWYNDFFYAYGIQEISNAITGRRRVFFINKISCQ
ncbi:MAG: hypothetical protein ABIS36_17150 [Chryseolinea sp.]